MQANIKANYVRRSFKHHLMCMHAGDGCVLNDILPCTAAELQNYRLLHDYPG